MKSLKILDFNEVLVGEIAEKSHWLAATLETNMCWTIRTEKVSYLENDYFFVPITTTTGPAVVTKIRNEERNDVRSRMLRFLSALSWSQRSGILVKSFREGGLVRTLVIDSNRGQAITEDLFISYLPEPKDDLSRIALGLMREGLALNHPAYAFLSFYRVLEAAIPKGKMRGEWVNRTVSEIKKKGDSQKVLDSLEKLGVADISHHIYKTRRMAIAHASELPIADPDDASDFENIQSELPLMRDLAEKAIENVLGIKTTSQMFCDHLYELDGFKDSIGSAQLTRILAGKNPSEGESIDLPIIDVEMRRSEPFDSLRSMRPVHVAQHGQCLQIVYQSTNGLVEIIFVLDFKNERLIFDWQCGLVSRDDGSTAAARHAAELSRFILEYIGNGELHIFDSETRKLISRVDAFIPTNYMVNDEALNRLIQEWREEATRRETANTTEY